MTIFGDLYINRSFPESPYKILYNHTQSTADLAVNYTFGIISLLATLAALLLNPIVFYYNFKQKSSTASLIFQILAVFDFSHSVYRSSYQSYILLKPDLEQFVNMHPSTLARLSTVLTYSIGQSNISLTGLLALVRLIQIRFPLWAFGHTTHIYRASVCLIVLDILYNVTAITYYICHYKISVFLSFTQMVWALPDDLVTYEDPGALDWIVWMFFTGPYYVKTGLTLLTSIATVITLKQSASDSGTINENQGKSIMTILILNLAPFFWVVLMIATQVILDGDFTDHIHYQRFYLIYFSFVGMPVVLTGYNPLVLCCRSSGIRKMVRDWWGRRKVIGEWYSASSLLKTKSGSSGRRTNVTIVQPSSRV